MAYIIGLAGGSASGKTCFLQDLEKELGDSITIISQDDYYLPIEEQQKDSDGFINFDIPSAINRSAFTQDIKQLLSGNSVKIKEYTFNNPHKKEFSYKILEPKPIILIEGLFVYHFEEISPLFELSLYIDAREEIRFERRKKRDLEERGIDLNTFMHQWENHVNPSYKQYLEPYKSLVDIVINNNKSYKKALTLLSNHLENQLTWQINSQL